MIQNGIASEIRDITLRYIRGEIDADMFVNEFVKRWSPYLESDDSKHKENYWIERAMSTADSYGHPNPDIFLSADDMRKELSELIGYEDRGKPK